MDATNSSPWVYTTVPYAWTAASSDFSNRTHDRIMDYMTSVDTSWFSEPVTPKELRCAND